LNRRVQFARDWIARNRSNYSFLSENKNVIIQGTSNVSTMLEPNLQDPPPLPWCIDRVGDVDLPECAVPLAASATALNETTTLAAALPLSNAKLPSNQLLAPTNQIAMLQDEVTYPNNESLMEWNDASTSGNDEVAVNDASFSQVPPSASNISSNEKDELKRVNALKKHPYNYHMKQQPSSGLIWN